MSNLVEIDRRSRAHPLRHAGGGRLREAERRVHAAAVPAARGRCRGRPGMKALSNSACIVGVDESDEIGILPNKSQLALHLEAITNAVPRRGPQGLRRGRHLHRRPAFPVAARRGAGHHAALRRRHHRRRLLVHHDGRPRGGRAAPRPLRRGGHLPRRVRSLAAWASRAAATRAITGQFEIPYGFGAAPTYFGMITTRHMHEYGTTLEQWAQVAVSTREVGGAQPQGAQPRPHHGRRTCSSSRPVA